MPLRMTGLASGMDTESMIQELMKAQRMKSTKIENKITKLEWTQEKWKSLNSKIYSFYTGVLSKARMESSYLTKKATSSNEGIVEVDAKFTAPEGTHTIKVNSKASSQFVTGGEVQLTGEKAGQKVTYNTLLKNLGFGTTSEVNITVGTESFKFQMDESKTIGDFVETLQDAGLNVSFDTTYQRFFISSKETGLQNKFMISSTGNDLDKLGLGTSNGDTIVNGEEESGTRIGANGLTVVSASDAEIIYNGATLTSSSNTLSVNGLSITVKGVTDKGNNVIDPSDDEVINININNDTQAVYDMITDFIKSYNELLKEVNTGYYADSSRGYDPLTDEQRKAMSDEEVEKWENKIKDSLLRRDNNLYSVMNAMKAHMSQKVAVNNKGYSLVNFGVAAVDYSEKGILHINGDEDDTLVAIKENDLMKALTEDPETVMKVFTELAGDLYKTMTEQMESTSLRSALSFYNDKLMSKTLKQYKEDLSDMENKLIGIENRYYRQFAAMETALSQMNAQSSSMASLLGLNTQK